MSLRKTQLKKMTLQEIMTRLSNETDSDNIKLINSFISQKNAALVEKRQTLVDQIELTRKKIQKNVHGLNYNIKDRIERKEKMVLDKDSRPSSEEMTTLMQLYTYMENQGNIMDSNMEYVQQLASNIRSKLQMLQGMVSSKANNQHLDLQYQELHRRCEEQEQIRNKFLEQRNTNRNHYANIIKTIQECRVQYESVQSQIRDNQRELIRITTYYNARLAQDHHALVQLPRQAVEYEMELLLAQNKLNQSECSYQQRLMRQIEVKNAISR